MDESLKMIFDALNSTGRLNDTVIIGSGDHGEFTGGGRRYIRLWQLRPHILHPLTYMYIPRELLLEEERTSLLQNTNRLVSTLDIFPSLQHMLRGRPEPVLSASNSTVKADIRNSTSDLSHNFSARIIDFSSKEEQDHCITGYDLFGTEIPLNRVAISFTGVSDQHDFLGALSTDDDKGLYVRRKKNKTWQITFDQCTSQNKTVDCMQSLTSEDLKYWRVVVENLRANNSSHS